MEQDNMDTKVDMTGIEVKECPYYLISRASLAITAALRRELAAAAVWDVRPAYLGVLLSLWNEDGLRIHELGRRAGLEPSTMTGLLDRMERDSLVSREPDPSDRRAHRVVLSERGHDVKEAVLEVIDRTMEAAFVGIDDADTETVKRLLRQVLANTDRVSP
jgi:DNA-binding MarR family transcriptional regulator